MGTRTYKQALDEKKEMERQIELISLRNLTNAIAKMAHLAHSIEEFADNLDKLVGKFDEMIK